MQGSITAVFERCMHEAGKPIINRGRAYKCPFHESASKKFYLYEDKRGWHCYSGKCPYTKGGIVQLVMAFGFALNETEVSKWLAERGLIAPSESTGSPTPLITNFRRTYIVKADLDAMDDEQMDVWRDAQIDLRNAIGSHYFMQGRMHIAGLRYERNERRKSTSDAMRLMLESIERHCGPGGKCACGCPYSVELRTESKAA